MTTNAKRERKKNQENYQLKNQRHFLVLFFSLYCFPLTNVPSYLFVTSKAKSALDSLELDVLENVFFFFKFNDYNQETNGSLLLRCLGTFESLHQSHLNSILFYCIDFYMPTNDCELNGTE